MAVRVDYQNAKIIDDLDTIYITGAGFKNKAFKGVGRNSAWGYDEVVWGANLSRSVNFAMTNIDNVRIGSVTNVHIIFPVMNIQDFIDIQKILHERHCIVNFYNVDKGIRETKEMAITSNERKTIYNFGSKILGMRDFTIKMVATNRKIDEDTGYKIGVDLPIVYNPNGGVGEIITDVREYTDQYIVRSAETYTNPGYHIEEWNTKPDGTGATYLPNLSITINDSLELFAIWK